MKKASFSLVLFAATLGFAAASARADSLLINGAGATFPYPLYSKWFAEYAKVSPAAQFNYQSIGSGGGVKQFLEKTVDFGASDAPMNAEQIAKSAGPVVHLPMALGAVVVTYNLGEIAKGLHLTPDVLADIFLGKITQWNDPRIVAANPSLKLPATAVMVAHRSDGSGTSAIFTEYLAKVSADWKSRVGSGASVNWPAGLGGKGNEGVTGLVKQTPGAIGYVELIYAEKNSLPYAAIKNRSGQFALPSLKGATAAAAASAKSFPTDLAVTTANVVDFARNTSITDAAGADAYPISSFTYLLLPTQLTGPKGKEIAGFLKWALTTGQKSAADLLYAPLPAALAKSALHQVELIKAKN